MGRRKIEIQPITHERNRSVTFVKRKLGLMKKAYELGVLCSVDVAVIIFEDRPGQEPKLFQYCSTNMRNMIARHGEHDGERDTKGPSDFSGADKNEDAVGEDDDEVEDDDPPPPPPKKKAKPNKDDAHGIPRSGNQQQQHGHSEPADSQIIYCCEQQEQDDDPDIERQTLDSTNKEWG
ncbi:SRF-like protein [Mycena chlorophos]|uniref:SRF-like protein n=1 Tax=Mycena chlorophos TaxID=658473 RepID=A0A8H6TJ96_MYCCL|nr:SRF-like protein [Mycena chlorophos]